MSFCSFFFFKQKTAYEMRISDWSSDVCSSDLIPPAEDGRGNPLPGIEPQRVDEVAAGQPAAASGRPGGGRCRSVEDADSGHGRSCERKEGHDPERGRMSLVGWDEKTAGCQARLTSRCSAA